jgi:hypothetical protein
MDERWRRCREGASVRDWHPNRCCRHRRGLRWQPASALAAGVVPDGVSMTSQLSSVP